MKITSVEPDSPLFGLIRPGHKLLNINDRPVTDNIDYRFRLADEAVKLEFEGNKGEKFRFKIRFESTNDLGLIFEEDKILTCKNSCIFCFVHQQPKGMRRALYVRDDDYRLSFTHGNFISLSNLTDEDSERIISQRLSPLYISVHTTDDELRRQIFRNPKLPSIMAQLKHLTKHGIKFHTQVVVCPGVNDGGHLDKTVADLFKLYPGVATVGVVPVGLNRYRGRLTDIKPFDKQRAEETLEFVQHRQKECLLKCGSRFVFAADELYLKAGREFPRVSEYEEMAQFENGIGMMRSFLSEFNRKKRSLKRPKGTHKLALLTGESALGHLSSIVMPYLKKARGIRADLFGVENRFWGRSVTVSGLLTGGDIHARIRAIDGHYDVILLPPNCLNADQLFLDDLSVDELQRKTKARIQIGSYDLVESLNEALL